MRRILTLGIISSLLLIAIPASADVEEIQREVSRVATATFSGSGGFAFAGLFEVSPGTEGPPPGTSGPWVYAYYQLGDPCQFEGRFESGEYDMKWSMDHVRVSFDTGNPNCGVVEVVWEAIDGGWDYSDRLNVMFNGVHHIRNIQYNEAHATMTLNGVQPDHLTLGGAGIEQRAVTTIIK